MDWGGQVDYSLAIPPILYSQHRGCGFGGAGRL